MPTTSGAPWNIPSPTLPEAPDGPGDMQELAGTVHSSLARCYPCTSTSRPSHVEGLLIYESDTDIVQISDGTNWQPMFSIGNKPMALMRRTTVQSIPNAVLTPIVFTSADANSRGITTNTTTGKLEVTRTGRYNLRACVAFAIGGVGYRAALIRLNTTIVASDYRNPQSTVASIHNFGTVWPVLCTAGDTIDAAALHTQGAALDVTDANANLSLGAEWVGPY
jgi:hypothetical protein